MGTKKKKDLSLWLLTPTPVTLTLPPLPSCFLQKEKLYFMWIEFKMMPEYQGRIIKQTQKLRFGTLKKRQSW